MTYLADSVNDANPGPAIYAKLEVALLAAGFTLVDTVVIATRTHKIFKSPAGSNAHGADWYLDVHYTTTGAATLRFTVFEDYNPTTDTGYRGTFIGGGTTVDATTYSRYGAAGSALETNWSTSIASVSLAVSTTVGFWFSATPDRVILMTTAAVSSLLYAGLYDPSAEHASHAGAALFPLIVANVTASSESSSLGGTAGLTRAPKRAGGGAFDWQYSVNIATEAAAPHMGGVIGGAASTATGLTKVVPLPVRTGMGTTVGAITDYVGVLIDVGLSMAIGGAVRGDTAQSGAWVLTTPSSSRSLLFRAV